VFVCHQVNDFAIALDSIKVANYIKLYCESYINKVLLLHGWSEPSPMDSTHHDMVPLSPDSVSCLQELIRPPENLKEHLEIEGKLKFSYQGLLGKLLYALIIVHVEIRNAVQFLSTFSASPHHEHYMALKNVCQYLQKHKSDGLMFWRTKSVDILLHVPFKIRVADPQLPPFPKYGLSELVAFADDAYTTDSKT